jgi:hypothetical protein
MSKGLGLSIEDVLYKYSYASLLLLSSTLPSYEPKTEEQKKEEEWDDSLDANIPGNFTV